MTDRAQFEKWISSPPFECSVKRYSEDPAVCSWPGNYKDIEVMLAWEAWQKSAAFAREQLADAKNGRAICEALGFDPTNHHNAAKCPYCTPQLAETPDAGDDGEAAGPSKPYTRYPLDPFDDPI